MSGTPDVGAFIGALLARLGAPANDSNRLFLAAWMQREGTSATFNPLATTLACCGGSSFNTVGVKNYPDLPNGVEATARTLLGGYPHIVADLRAGNGAAASQEHAELSKWSGGGYSSITLDLGRPTNPLDAAAAAAGAIPNPADAVSAVGDALDAIGHFLGVLASWQLWRRVLYLVAGGIAVVVGLVVVAGDTREARQLLSGLPAAAAAGL